MYSEDDLIQLSALQHFVFCQRQCALIHIEQVWMENLFTAQGRVMHNRAHEGKIESRGGDRIERGMFLRSFRLGLSGKADVVEFHKDGDKFTPFPIEYKRGKPKRDLSDKVQLCAQALCLEEMLEVPVLRGALFYGKIRRRLDVEFEETLRAQTMDTAEALHKFIEAGITPLAEYSQRCRSCSLVDVCIPRVANSIHSVKEYLLRETKEE